MANQSILNFAIKDKNALYAAYMPFIVNGGLFIQTKKTYRLGDEVFMLLTLMDEKERLPVAGRVIWITPTEAQGNRVPGIGIQFGNQDNGATQRRIEGLLAGALQTERPTHSM